MSFIDAANQIIGDDESPYALIGSTQRYIGGIIANVTVREVHTDEDTITVHPVETGTPVSDHVFANPQIVEIACGFSDSAAAYTGYVQQVYQEFLALKATRQPFDVSTGKRLYSNMLFANITVVTDESSENALMVTARLQQIIMANSSGSGSSGPGALDPSAQADPATTMPSFVSGNTAVQPAPGSAPVSFDSYLSGFPS